MPPVATWLAVPASCLVGMRRRLIPALGMAVVSGCVGAGVAGASTFDGDYTLSAHGLSVLKIETHVQLSQAGYAITTHSHTVGLLGFVAHSDVTSVASGRFVEGHVQPIRFASSGRSRGADRLTRISYPDHDPVVELARPEEPERDPVPAAETRGSIDTLSAVVGLSREAMETGRCDGTTLVFDGHRLSRLEAHTVGTEILHVPADSGFSGQALRCDFVSRQLAGFLHDANRARLMKPLHGSAWLAAPGPGAPIAAVKAVFESPLFGTATLNLTKASTSP